jgi:hypothetical protein
VQAVEIGARRNHAVPNWIGASLLAKITRDRAPLDTALAGTLQLLGCTTPRKSGEGEKYPPFL